MLDGPVLCTTPTISGTINEIYLILLEFLFLHMFYNVIY